jgi:hypothetical protein
MTSSNTAKESGIRLVRRRRAVRLSAAASGLAVVMGCVAATPALASPTEPRQVHVEGQLFPVEESPGVYHRVISSGPFSGAVLTMRDIPIGNSDEILSTYEGDLQVKQAPVGS